MIQPAKVNSMSVFDWNPKIWGRTRLLPQTDQDYHTHQLEVMAGTCCSYHYHEQRSNSFVVLSGKVRIVWTIGWCIYYADLAPHQQCHIPSLVPHQFQVIESGEMLERYYADRGGVLDIGDIQRLTTGCKLQENIKPFKPEVYSTDGTPIKRMSHVLCTQQ